MSPTAHTVARTRWAVRIALRLALLAALLMAAWALYREVGAWRGIVRNFERARAGGQAVVGPNLVATITTTWRWLMIAALVLAADLFALRLLVPMPRSGCPQCGYDVDASKQPRCPECGLALAPPGRSRMPKIPYEAAVARQQIAVAAVRAAAVICLLAGLSRLAQWMIQGATYGNLGDFGEYSWAMAEGTMLVLSGAAAALWSHGIARLLLGGAAVDLCPGCGYQVADDTDRCPECGLTFAPAVALAGAVSLHDAILRRRHLMRALIRVAVLYILVVTSWQFAAGIAWVAASYTLSDYDEVRDTYLVSYSVNLAVGLALAGLVRLAERRLILWMTPVAPAADDLPAAE